MEKVIVKKKYIFCVCMILSTALHFFLPISLEAYEKIFSVLVSGTYTDYAIKDYDTDVHFLLFSLYAAINKIFPNVPIYGYVIVGYNILSLSLFGYILFHLLSRKLSSALLIYVFPVAFLVVSSFQIINLSSTRIVLISCGSLFYLIHSDLIRTKRQNVYLLVSFLLLSLIRIDATLLAAMIFLLISVFLKKLRVQHFFSLIVSVAVFVSFNIMMSDSGREDKKVYYYRELDLLDRNNIDFNHLSERDSLYVTLLTNYFIMDVNHFKIEYVNKLLSTKSSGFFNSLLNYKLFLNTLFSSLIDIYYARWLILVCLFLLVCNVFYLKPRWRHILLLALLFILPFLLCFYISLPLRFIEPYYIMYSIVLASLFPTNKVYYLLVSVLFILAYNNIISGAEKYKTENKNFLINYNYLVSKSSKTQPIVIENVVTGNFFPSDPLFNLNNTHAVFLNFGFFNSYECYKDSWRRYCHCNALSLIQKLEYVSANNIDFIMSEEMAKVYEKYLRLYWGREIRFVKTNSVNGEINSYKVIF